MLSIYEERALRKIGEHIRMALTCFESDERLPKLMEDFVLITKLHIHVVISDHDGAFLAHITPSCSVTNNERILLRTHNLSELFLFCNRHNMPIWVEDALPEHRSRLRKLFVDRGYRMWEGPVR